MIILDTNVISEVMRGPVADRRVVEWIRSLKDQPVTTVINRAEILAGVALLPEGARRTRLETVADEALSGLGVCLPLLPECAVHYAEIVAVRRAVGRPIAAMDALIGAIARITKSPIATRDVEGFADLGLDVINPWSAA